MQGTSSLEFPELEFSIDRKLFFSMDLAVEFTFAFFNNSVAVFIEFSAKQTGYVLIAHPLFSNQVNTGNGGMGFFLYGF